MQSVEDFLNFLGVEKDENEYLQFISKQWKLLSATGDQWGFHEDYSGLPLDTRPTLVVDNEATPETVYG